MNLRDERESRTYKRAKELFSKLTLILGVNSKAVRYFDEDETNNIYIIAPILPIKR